MKPAIEYATQCERNYFCHLSTKENIAASLCGIITFPSVLGLFQNVLWKNINISAHMRLAGVCGMVTVGFSAVVSTAVTVTAHDVFIGLYPETSLARNEVVSGTILSLVQFLMLSQTFKVVLPSHVLHPGAFSRGSLPLHTPVSKVSHSQKQRIQAMGHSNGCHTCGKSFTSLHVLKRKLIVKFFPTKAKPMPFYFADHSPPQALVGFYSEKNKILQGRIYPQCQQCSNFQSSIVRKAMNSKQTAKHWPNRTGVVTHALRFKWWKIWLPWPILINSNLIPEYFYAMYTYIVT